MTCLLAYDSIVHSDIIVLFLILISVILENIVLGISEHILYYCIMFTFECIS
jgi:hypothetical protein